MPVKFWLTSIRLWFFLSYLITTVKRLQCVYWEENLRNQIETPSLLQSLLTVFLSIPLNKLPCKSSSKGDCDKSSHVCCIEQQGNRAFDILKANLPEKCRTPQGKGLCKSASKCETVSAGNKKQGGCSKRSEVCCYYERPQGVTDRQVTRALSKTNVSTY